ncbi:MAG: alpha-glucan family phosphorylase [Bacteroidales bacterium]|nr:alpha-glucan family phosphorylase [Bacteroidales bacterium]
MLNNKNEIDTPSWKSVMVTRHLPEELSGLEMLCKNLWWCWNDDAKALFKTVDYDLWHSSGHNPMVILDKVSLKRYKQLAGDEEFLSKLRKVMERFTAYMRLKEERKGPKVAYFCMEYGLDSSLKIYSGGLGILAGDYLKESSDMNVDMVAVGLFYRYGYFTQKITPQGNQVSQYDAQDFLKTPAEPVLDANGNWLTIDLSFPWRILHARVWKVAVGRTDLYLLDTDFEANSPEDRQITHHLYGGDWENRLKQEILLGIGGIRTLRALGIGPVDVYHCNEGHAAFTGLERLREYIQDGNYKFDEALELVRASGLFTTHTPVPAGHDAFDEGMLHKYFDRFPSLIGTDWDTMMSLGKLDPYNREEKFSMSFLAANISQNVNGVSMLHGKVSQEIFAGMYPGYLPEELHVGYVTNGVHYNTWASNDWKALHATVFGPEFASHHYDKRCFEGIYEVSDEAIWAVRKEMKKDLMKTIRERLSDPALSGHYSPGQVVTISDTLKPDVLTIGFARRFATYKRATLLFRDLDRLDALVNNPERPVQFIFAGKAHPADGMGQDLIRQIVEISKQPRFLGKIVFLPGYDITVAKRMVQGVDVWLNNPTRPLEASGTSGEKASMNGVMHLSVLDGWWVEGYKEGCGWALPQEKTYDDDNYQSELDSATIYTLIENEIAPAYYNRDKATGLSSQWISYIKNTIAKVASEFTTNRMLSDYCDRYYIPQAERSAKLHENNGEMAREIAAWKRQVSAAWKGIRVVSYTQPEASYVLSEADQMSCKVVLDLGGLSPEDIGVEILFVSSDNSGSLHINEQRQFNLDSFENGTAVYSVQMVPERTGLYQVGTRIYPKNSLLPHRQDFPLVKWL